MPSLFFLSLPFFFFPFRQRDGAKPSEESPLLRLAAADAAAAVADAAEKVDEEIAVDAGLNYGLADENDVVVMAIDSMKDGKTMGRRRRRKRSRRMNRRKERKRRMQQESKTGGLQFPL